MLSKCGSLAARLGLPVMVLGIWLLLFFLYFPSQAAPTATYVVNTTSDAVNGPCNEADCSLREAILAANGTAQADLITFSLPPNSTITLNGSQLPIITGTLTIDGRTAVNLTIDGGGSSRLMVIGAVPPPYPGPLERPVGDRAGSAAMVSLIGLTLTNGSEPEGLGGGIFNDGILMVIDTTVSDTVSKHGAIYNNHRLEVENSTFINNSAPELFGGGAGLFNASTGVMTVTNSSFVGNIADAPASNGGGGILNRDGQLVVYDSVFDGNSATNFGGGAIQLAGGTNLIENNTFTDNYSSFVGGAISGGGAITITNNTFDGNIVGDGAGGAVNLSGTTGSKAILNSTFHNNTSEYGGAVYIFALATIANSTFYNNTADFGGAIYIEQYLGDLTLVNSTISHNSAGILGGGIYNNRFLDIINTIVANSLGGGDCFAGTPIGINTGNLIEDGSCSPALSGEPQLGPLVDNGGLTATMLPSAGSPAIDSGSNADCESYDQRGWLRPIDGDENGTAVCDIGAVEVGPWLEFMAAVFRP